MQRKRKYTTSEVCKLDIADVKKTDLGSIAWQSGDNIIFHFRREQVTIIHGTGYRQTISIEYVPSNLGKGELPFFVCPYTGKRSKIIYMIPGSGAFRSRAALKGTIYYPLQACTARYRANTRYFAIKRRLDRLTNKRDALNYNGHPTKRWHTTTSLNNNLMKADRERLAIFTQAYNRNFPACC